MRLRSLRSASRSWCTCCFCEDSKRHEIHWLDQKRLAGEWISVRSGMGLTAAPESTFARHRISRVASKNQASLACATSSRGRDSRALGGLQHRDAPVDRAALRHLRKLIRLRDPLSLKASRCPAQQPQLPSRKRCNVRSAIHSCPTEAEPCPPRSRISTSSKRPTT